jgi:hypothetical protein
MKQQIEKIVDQYTEGKITVKERDIMVNELRTIFSDEYGKRTKSIQRQSSSGQKFIYYKS